MSDKDKDRQQKTQQNKFWLQTQVNDILEPMVLACCQAKADNKVSIKYFQPYIHIFNLVTCITFQKRTLNLKE